MFGGGIDLWHWLAFGLGWASCLLIQFIALLAGDFKTFVADRFAQDALCDRAWGDVPFVPANDLKPVHAPSFASEEQHNHA